MVERIQIETGEERQATQGEWTRQRGGWPLIGIAGEGGTDKRLGGR